MRRTWCRRSSLRPGARPTRYDATRGSVASWLLMMSRSRAIDRLRSRRAQPDATRHDRTVVDLPDPALGAEQRVLTAESAAGLRTALAALPLTQRVAIELAYFEGVTQTQIADRLDLVEIIQARRLLRRLRSGVRTAGR